jgi:hypothetical protein
VDGGDSRVTATCFVQPHGISSTLDRNEFRVATDGKHTLAIWFPPSGILVGERAYVSVICYSCVLTAREGLLELRCLGVPNARPITAARDYPPVLRQECDPLERTSRCHG